MSIRDFLEPRSTSQVSRDKNRFITNRRVIDTISIPESMIRDVVPNPDAKRFLPPEFQSLIDPESIRKRAKLSFLRSVDTEVKTFRSPQLVPDSFGRATVEGYCDVDYGTETNRLVGNVMIGKGALLSGHYYHRDIPNFSGIIGAADPLGFYGQKEAHQEMKILGALLEAGGRMGLFCGYIILDPVETKQYVREMFSQLGKEVSAIARDRLEVELQTVLSNVDVVVNTNKDQLVYTSRLMGTTERLSAAEAIWSSSKEILRCLGFLRHGARILARELELTDKPVGDVSAKEAIGILKAVGNGDRLNQESVGLYNQVINAIIHDDLSAIARATTGSKLAQYSPSSILSESTQKKDTDFSLKHVDYEMAAARTKNSLPVGISHFPELLAAPLEKLSMHLMPKPSNRG